MHEVRNSLVHVHIAYSSKPWSFITWARTKFQEQVELLEINDFITLFSQTNLQLVDLFGDYQLQAYDKELSKRQILIFQ